MTLSLYMAALASTVVAQQGAPFTNQTAASVIHDDDSAKSVVVLPPLPSARGLSSATYELEDGATSSARIQTPKPVSNQGTTPSFGQTRVESLLKRPMTQVSDSEAVVRGKNYKAILSEDSLRFSPVVGNRPDADVSFSLMSIERGGDALPMENGKPRDTGSALQIDRGAAVEAYHYALDGIEQTFTFHELPGAGDLVVRMGVETDLAANFHDGELSFENELARVTYSSAFVFDANGKRASIETSWSNGDLALTVPAAYLAGATLPVTIDPLINSFTFGVGTADDSKPDIAFDASRDRYFVAFEDVVSATDSDLYGFSVSDAGAVDDLSFLSLALGSIDMRQPRVAVNPSTRTFLVVAAGLPSGDLNRRIYGVRVAVDAAAPTGLVLSPAFEINDSPGSRDCFDADVAGNNFPSSTESFAVVWTRAFSATDNDVHGRIVNVDESFATGRINIDNSGQDDLQCSISSSIGDTGTADYYNVVWIRDDGTNPGVTGDVYSRRLYFDGSFTGPHPANLVLVADVGNAFEPVTTSTLDDPLPMTGELVNIVAYNRLFLGQASIYANVVTFANDAGPSQGISIMEDFGSDLDQRDVSIATDRDGFMMTYSELFGTSSTDYDTYYCSGHLQDGPGGSYRVTLAERHQNMAFSGSVERFPAIATQFDGGVFSNPTNDDACAVWEDVSSTTSSIEGYTMDLLNNAPIFGDQSIGTQYCRAELNNDGNRGWIRAVGPDQSVGSSKTLQAIDVTTNAFGYLLISSTTAFIPNPAGARGNLCVTGSGRYIDQIANSGVTGTLSATVNPANIPQPTGFQSINAGETWNFQFWTRDIAVGGGSTSNFTNAVSVTFTP